MQEGHGLCVSPLQDGIYLYREEMEGIDTWLFQKCHFLYLQLKTNMVLHNERQQDILQCLAQNRHTGAFSGCCLIYMVRGWILVAAEFPNAL